MTSSPDMLTASPNIFVNVYDEATGDWLGIVDIELPEFATDKEKNIIETASRILVRSVYGVAVRAARHEAEQSALKAAKLGRLLSLTYNNEADVGMSFDILDEIQNLGYMTKDLGEGKFSLERVDTDIEEPYIEAKIGVNTMTTIEP